jgi:hypothetical protein
MREYTRVADGDTRWTARRRRRPASVVCVEEVRATGLA